MAAVLVALVVPAAGCGDTDSRPVRPDRILSATVQAASTPARAYTVEQLAAEIGCEPEFQGKATDFRQAVCAAGGDEIVLLQFDEAAGQRDWLAYATAYGGVYLVGDRWVLSGKSRDYLEMLRATLGGSIEDAGGP